MSELCDKLVLYCGFQPITFDEKHLRDSTKKKGRDLVVAQHAFNVHEICERGIVSIVGLCLPETNVRNKPYHICLDLDSARKVKDGKCSCIAGITATCKHAAALLHFVNNERTNSCTDREMVWSAPSKIVALLWEAIEMKIPVAICGVIAAHYATRWASIFII